MVQILLELGRGWLASFKARARTLRGSVRMNPKLMTQSRQMVTALLMMVSVITSTGAGGMPAIAAPQSPPPITPTSKLSLQVAQNSIPPATVEILRQDLSQRTGIPTNQLRFIEVSPQTFPNGCLGLAGANEMCTQMMVSGWRVTFANGSRRWVYRTNANGSTFRLESSTQAGQPNRSKPVSLQPTQIPSAEMPPRLQKDVVFRAIATGGLTGRTYQTTLYRNGNLVRQEMRLDNQPISAQVRQISLQEVRQFMTLLRQNQLHRLHRANYLPTPGSADFITTTLSCQVCTIRYADSIQGELPENLQSVIQAWNNLTRTI